MSTFYITTAIPYVNAVPHLGFALELVQADVLARHRRSRGDRVRALTGTDDHALKNVQAAEAAGADVRSFVDANAERFAALAGHLDLSFDDFIRTSSDPRHRPAVGRLWQRCAASGDLYRRHYEGLYCDGCEAFVVERDLVGGRCAEHGTEPCPRAEENWYFNLGRYRDRLQGLVSSGALRIEPEGRRNEVLGLLAEGPDDFSVSRRADRARGWGIPVPGDPEQVVYVWFDALGNYVSALGYGTGSDAFREWWCQSDERVHVIGKGILRFHALYWPAILLSAGEPLPTTIFVHDYLTVEGRKIGKSLGNAVDPVALAERYGSDALRWWLLRDVPRVGDADFTVERLVERADTDLANGLGNLVHRTVTLVHRFRGGVVPRVDVAPVDGGIAEQVDVALARFDFRGALAAIWSLVEDGNRLVDAERPWELARAEREGERGATVRLDAVLARLVATGRGAARHLAPFVPGVAAAVVAALDGERLPEPRPVFPRLSAAEGLPPALGACGAGPLGPR